MAYNRILLCLLLIFTWNFQVVAVELSPMELELSQIQENLQSAATLPYSRQSYKYIAKSLDAYKAKYKGNIKANKNYHQRVSKIGKLTQLQAKFQECLKRFDNPNSVGNQVLQMAFSIDAGTFECEDLEHSTEKSLSAIGSIAEAAVLTELHDKMIENTMVNSLSNIIDIEYRIKDSNKSDDQILKDAVLAACGGKTCSRQDYKKLSNIAKQQLSEMKKNGVERLTATQTAENMNIKIREINDEAQFPFPIMAHSKNTLALKKQAYNKYAAKFWDVSSSGTGLLLHTENLSDKMGALEDFDGSDYQSLNKRRNGSMGGMQTYKRSKPPHKDNLKSDDISKAKKEYYNEMMSIAQERIEDKPKYKANVKSKSSATNQSIKKENLQNFGRFILNNPLAAAQTLMKNPQAIGIFCDAINAIEDTNESSKNISTFRRIALGVSGGLLVGAGALISFTGIGAAVGVPMMIAGAALTTAEVGFSAYDWYQADSAIDDIAAGMMSGNAGEQSQERLLEAKQEASDAIWGGAMAIGLSATGIGALAKGVGSVGKLFKIAKNSGRLKNTIAAVNKTVGMQKAKKMLPETSYAELVGMVSGLPKAGADAVIAALAKAKSPEEIAAIKKSVEEALSKMNCAV